MRFHLEKQRNAVGVIVAIAVAGCSAASSASPQLVSAGTEAFARAQDKVAKNVYVTYENSGNSTIFEYPAQNRNDSPPLCTFSLAQTVRGITADTSGNAYVSELEPGRTIGQVLVFAPNCGRQIGVVRDSSGGPVDAVALSGDQIFMPDDQGVSVCTLRGCTARLTDRAILRTLSVAVDRLGNVWAAAYGFHHSVVLVVWKQAHMPGHKVVGYVHDSPGYIMFDNSNNLVDVQDLSNEMYRFKCQLVYFQCIQLFRVTLHGGSIAGALDGINSDIQVTDFERGSVDVYTYPNLTYEYSYDNGLGAGPSWDAIAQVP